MEDFPRVVRALKLIRTAGAARVAVTSAIQIAESALARQPKLATGLRKVIADLQTYKKTLASLAAETPIVLNQRLVEKAYIESFGAIGETAARQSVSLLEELGRSSSQVGAAIAKNVKDVGNVAGEVAGGLAGGILKGLGPVVVLVLALALYVRFFR